MGPSERRRLTDEAIDSVGLSDRAAHKPNQLSGGQRQPVAIAGALVNRPSIILADDPPADLDRRPVRKSWKVFARLHQQGNTILLVTHEDEIARHARRVIKLRDGLIESDVETPS